MWLRGVVRRGLVAAGRGTADCEDIVQETLLAMHLKRDTWDAAQPVEPWLAAIARHKLVDYLRRRGFHDHVDIDDQADAPAPEAESMSTPSADSRQMLASLPERQRRSSRDLDRGTARAPTSALRLGMTEGAVRVTLHRALKALAVRYRKDSVMKTDELVDGPRRRPRRRRRGRLPRRRAGARPAGGRRRVARAVPRRVSACAGPRRRRSRPGASTSSSALVLLALVLAFGLCRAASRPVAEPHPARRLLPLAASGRRRPSPSRSLIAAGGELGHAAGRHQRAGLPHRPSRCWRSRPLAALLVTLRRAAPASPALAGAAAGAARRGARGARSTPSTASTIRRSSS